MIYTTGVRGSPSSYTHFHDYVEKAKAKIWLWSIVKKIDKQSAYSCYKNSFNDRDLLIWENWRMQKYAKVSRMNRYYTDKLMDLKMIEIIVGMKLISGCDYDYHES